MHATAKSGALKRPKRPDSLLPATAMEMRHADTATDSTSNATQDMQLMKTMHPDMLPEPW